MKIMLHWRDKNPPSVIVKYWRRIITICFLFYEDTHNESYKDHSLVNAEYKKKRRAPFEIGIQCHNVESFSAISKIGKSKALCSCHLLSAASFH